MDPEQARLVQYYQRWLLAAEQAILSAEQIGDTERAEELKTLIRFREKEWTTRGISVPGVAEVEPLPKIITYQDFVDYHGIQSRVMRVPREDFPFRHQYYLWRKEGTHTVFVALRDFYNEEPLDSTADLLEFTARLDRAQRTTPAAFGRAFSIDGDQVQEILSQTGIYIQKFREFLTYPMIRQFGHLRVAE